MGKPDLMASAVIVEEATDPERWRLKGDDGRQTWHYLESDAEVAAWPQTIADRHHLGLPLVSCLCSGAFSSTLVAFSPLPAPSPTPWRASS